jgi:hypothetical protein
MDSGQIIFSIAGGVAICFSISNLRRRAKILKNGVIIDATVVRTEKRRMHRGGHTYVPILRYTFEENEYEVDSDVSHMFEKYNNGETITILIDRHKPTSFIKQDDKVQLYGSIFFILIGLGLIFFAIFSVLK